MTAQTERKSLAERISKLTKYSKYIFDPLGPHDTSRVKKRPDRQKFRLVLASRPATGAPTHQPSTTVYDGLGDGFGYTHRYHKLVTSSNIGLHALRRDIHAETSTKDLGRRLADVIFRGYGEDEEDDKGEKDDKGRDDDKDKDKKEAEPRVERLAADLHTRRYNKIGGIALPGHPNLCYLNATIQALAATRFPFHLQRATQDAFGLSQMLPLHSKLIRTINAINQVFSRRFKGSLEKRIASGRVTRALRPEDLNLGYPFASDEGGGGGGGGADGASVERGKYRQQDVRDLVDALWGTLREEIANMPKLHRGWDERMTVQLVVERICMRCGHLTMESVRKPYIGDLQKPFAEGLDRLNKNWTIEVERTLEHFASTKTDLTRPCISCALHDLRDIHTRARHNLKSRARRERAATGYVSAQTATALKDISAQTALVNAELQYKHRTGLLPLTATGIVFGVGMSPHQQHPRALHSIVTEIGTLPTTVLLSYDLVRLSRAHGAVKNTMHLNVPPVLNFRPYFADKTAGAHVNANYECRAIVTHFGKDLATGRYYCQRQPWVKGESDESKHQGHQWWLCDEARTDAFAEVEDWPANAIGRRARHKLGGSIAELDYWRKYRFQETVPEGTFMPGEEAEEEVVEEIVGDMVEMVVEGVVAAEEEEREEEEGKKLGADEMEYGEDHNWGSGKRPEPRPPRRAPKPKKAPNLLSVWETPRKFEERTFWSRSPSYDDEDSGV
ncbi:hypothetical protein DRE_01818 [Drechslerella stenobrocha 248]|uniref:ubiquitinyl hydrolase 1 n=1 Tax=Drechslerella stenobrocha 248 TaxID=1043628 RepID=W7HWP8_9PEZI|nr:hypothetical protein DRE_01818 [Drechslerella stenobrocha 248]